MIKAKKSGFTLPEALLTIVLIGILSGLAFPKVHGIMDKGYEKKAVVKAEALNAAKVCFKMRCRNAQQLYRNERSDESRFKLLKQYVPFSENGLKSYIPKGFSMSLGESIDEKVALSKGHETIHY